MFTVFVLDFYFYFFKRMIVLDLVCVIDGLFVLTLGAIFFFFLKLKLLK
jgi:hypothetical protein